MRLERMHPVVALVGRTSIADLVLDQPAREIEVYAAFVSINRIQARHLGFVCL